MQDHTTKRLLTDAMLENEYGIPRATSRTMRVRGGGPVFLKVGSRVYYRREDIEQYLNERRVASTAEVAAAKARR